MSSAFSYMKMVLTRAHILQLRVGFDAFKSNVSRNDDMSIDEIYTCIRRVNAIQRANVNPESCPMRRMYALKFTCRISPMLLKQMLNHPEMHSLYSRTRVHFMNMCDRVLAEIETNCAIYMRDDMKKSLVQTIQFAKSFRSC